MYLRPRIEFYRRRDFTEKMNVTFDFIRENWHPLLKYTFFIIMPVCLIQTFFMNSIVSGMFSSAFYLINTDFGSSMASFFVNYGILMFCIMVGSSILSGLIYAMMQTYSTRENRLQDVVLDDFREHLVRNTWKCLKLTAFMIVVFVIIVAFAAFLAVSVSEVTLGLTVPLIFLMLLCAVPLILTVPVYIFERDITLFAAIVKAWKLGVSTLWGMIGFIIVLYFITSVIETVMLIPWYVALIAGSIFSTTQDAGLEHSAIYKFILYLLGLIQSFGRYLSAVLTLIGLAFQYFHAREQVEGVRIEENIINFNKL